MLKRYIIIALLLPGLSFAADPTCFNPGQLGDMSIRNVMREQWGVKQSDIVMDKTKIELLDSQPLSKDYSKYLVHKIPDRLTLNAHWIILKTYTEDNPVNQIIKYTYYNNKNQQNVFIGSNIANDKKCSIELAGYLIVKHEF